ncbi:MAG: hypothetical protein ACO263_02265 [Cyclobacteriaceae bacterium]|jgi:hypothetical protein
MKKFLFTLVAIFSAAFTFAQKDIDERSDWQDRVFLGGGGGLGGGTDRFGNKYFSFSVTPVIGYMVTSKISTGSAFSYQSTNYSDIGVKFTQYGVMPFIRYNMDALFLTTEFNYLNIPTLDANYDTTERIFRTRLLAGAGYSVPVGGKTKINVVGLYDLAYDRQYFVSPWVFRVFFSL